VPAAFQQGPLPGLIIVHPRVFPDGRGSFFETYKQSEYGANGIGEIFVQDNHSVSVRGVLRGLHFQTGAHAQGKLVRVIRGAVWDVAVDLRPTSLGFGRWFGLELSARNRVQFYIPPGFAHGFLTLEDETEFCYKCTAEYHKPSERGIRWDDTSLAIEWPQQDVRPSVSEKDAMLPSWREWQESLL
jgi:dTDP-4-dehydrorhamnose 3,5-epimerase